MFIFLLTSYSRDINCHVERFIRNCHANNVNVRITAICDDDQLLCRNES